MILMLAVEVRMVTIITQFGFQGSNSVQMKLHAITTAPIPIHGEGRCIVHHQVAHYFDLHLNQNKHPWVPIQ